MMSKTVFLRIGLFLRIGRIFSEEVSLVAQAIKNLPAMEETWVPALG